MAVSGMHKCEVCISQWNLLLGATVPQAVHELARCFGEELPSL